MSLFSLKNVSYQYPLYDKKVVKNVSLDIEKGKVYGLLGPNEAGKTSLCNIIRGLIPQFYRGKLEGEVLLKGKPLELYSADALLETIGYVFQNPFTQISGVKETVFEEIAYGMENMGKPREEMISRTNELIKMFRLEELAERNPYALSGGQKQRVALVSILAADPELIIMDEPTSQLDPQSTEEVFEIIEMIKKQGKTIILVEHKIDLVAQYCDHIFLMNDGNLVMNGAVDEVLSNRKVMDYGVQLPQAAMFFLELAERGIKTDKIPLTVQQAYDALKKREVI